MKAVDFNLPDQEGVNRSLRDFSGKWLVLYFYPRDDTPGCTKEACNFRDSLGELLKLGTAVAGVSKDSAASHRKFADKYHLNFPILSDESKEVIKAYGAWGKKKFMGREFEGTLRKTILINPVGEVVKIYENVNPTQHAEEIINDIKEMGIKEELQR
jgi:thioredoxin-dependent peroxiredoxin